MSSINSNSGHFDNLNSSTVPIDAGESFVGVFSSCLNYAVIDVSVKCDSTYDIKINYSHDGVSEDFSDSITVSSISANTLFYEFRPKMRYYRIKIDNTDSANQTNLTLQTLLKSVVTYQDGGNSSNVAITSPLNLDGSVFVGGNLALSGSVDANITNTSLDVSDGDTHTKLDNIQTQLEKSNKATSTLWNNNLTGVNGVSLVANLSTVNQTNLTVYGSVNGATQIVVQFSNDGTNFYDSQYSYNQSASGDYGFNINSSPKYLRLKSTLSVTAYAFLNYC